MSRAPGLVLLMLFIASCRGYDYYAPLADDAGKIPADQFARYGREEAELMAIGREFAREPAAVLGYARGLPDVTDARVDTLNYWVTIQFRSGWRAATTPIADGKSAAETPGLPSVPARR